MAHSHYVMDLYFPEGESDRHRREALRIEAEDDDAAVLEAKRISGWRKPSSFQVRMIRTSARSGDKVIFSSEPPATDEDAAATPAATA